MSRKPRLHYPGALYHVILRGNSRQDIFFEDQDRYRFFLLVQEGVERFGHRVLAFCLMTNHIHLAIQVGNVPLSRILQNLSFRYTRWINWRQGRVGHLFQGRYKAFVVDGDAYLLELVAYLHLNPVRIGLVRDAGAYPWSSHRAYLGRETIPWLDTDFVLGQFSRKVTKARELVGEFVAGKNEEGHRKEFHGQEGSDSRFVGADGFVEEILRREDLLPERKPDAVAILTCVAKLYNLTVADLAAPGQKRLPSEGRMLAAWAVREFSDSSLAELGQMVGREASAMSAAATRFEVRQRQESRLSEMAQRLTKELEVSVFQA